MEKLLNKVESVEQRVQGVVKRYLELKKRKEELEAENQRFTEELKILRARVNELSKNGVAQEEEVVEEWKRMREEVNDCLVELELCLKEIKE